MKFFRMFVLIIYAIITVNSVNEVSAIECCNPESILFRPEAGLTCNDFPNTKFYEHEGIFNTVHEDVCETLICKDGKYHKHCSDGECSNCEFFFFRCQDTADKCYGDHETFEDAFSKVWAKENYGVLDFAETNGRIIKFIPENKSE